MKLKTILVGVGILLLLTLALYLGVKSGKLFETLIGSGGILGLIAGFFGKRKRDTPGGASKRIDFSLSELEGIHQRYRDSNERIQSGLVGAKHEAKQLRQQAERDRERIRGYESAGSGVRAVAEELDELIRKIQEEGINP